MAEQHDKDIEEKIENFRRNFLEVCTYRHISLNRLSKRMGVSYQLIWAMRTGRLFNPRLSTVFSMAKALKVPIQIFFDDWPGTG